ncbi:AAA family ATPase [Thioalkalivibrio sp. HK1]|uniref:AAA family ATPase n=1 Tax=Thioalkalivibrio sp. HK1 TaxID=1469245 RepID=UPI0004701D92|nr:AAA family ATPase [Thioalkalivibrio sp. HK1]
MKNNPKVKSYKTLSTLANRIRQEAQSRHCVLLFAYNRTGKTRLSMEFKDKSKRKGATDTLYFNAFTEDLFTWNNDLDGDTDRHLTINKGSTFFSGMKELALEPDISGYLSRYADFDFDIDYDEWAVFFRNSDANRIKISRGEENIFIWCVFMAICERVIDGHESYHWVRYLYIDDPVSSLDDNNAIAVACDLAALVRNAASRNNTSGTPDPIRTVVSSHHALFFNVMCNELGRSREGQGKIDIKRFFMHQPGTGGEYALQSTGDTPYLQHVAVLVELQRCINEDRLYTYHFNAMRSILEKIATFLGHGDLRVCLKDLDDEALYNRALNLLSHGKYSVSDPTVMGEDNKQLFRRMFDDIVKRFEFALPELSPEAKPMKTNP